MRLNPLLTQILQETGVEGWTCGETWESIEFPEGYEKPPKEEFETKLQKRIDIQLLKELREERTNRLKATDFVVMPDFPYPSEEIRSAWLEYRQKLRNITATTTPSFDEDGQLVVTWPTPPIWPANVV
tara:strand:+ start:164 stop:547 length:384 start_codon:yes stop_codon:yes gene_type:complete